MIEPSEIDQIRHLFRLPSDLSLLRIERHIAGKVVHLSASSHYYFLQFYETLHNKRHIQTDLNNLRILSNLGFKVPTPLISRHGDSIETTMFKRPFVLYTNQISLPPPLTAKQIYAFSSQIPRLEENITLKTTQQGTGKTITTFFTQFEILAKEDHCVDEVLKSEYFAFKASYIELLNQTTSCSFGFFPGSDFFTLSLQNNPGFTHRNFTYDQPKHFALAQFILATCFTKEGKLDYPKLDAATSGYFCTSPISMDVFDETLKVAAFYELLCHWLASVFEPYLIHTDHFLNSRMKQNYLKTLTLKEVQ